MNKVLMLVWELPPNISGGLGIACDGILSGLASQANVITTVIAPSLSGLEEAHGARLFDAGLSADQVEISSYSISFGQMHKVQEFARKAMNIELYGGADVIHAHDWLTIPAALALRNRINCPILLHLHSTEFERAGPGASDDIVQLELEGMKAADLVVTVSERTRSTIVRKYGIAPDKVKVVYNGISKFKQTKKLMLLKERENIVTFVGRITYQKGPINFINIAEQLALRDKNIRFVMAGDGDMIEQCRKITRKLGLSERFSFPGFLDHNEVHKLLMHSKLFIMPSIYEPFGLVALEAIAAGVPAMISKTSGVAEIIKSLIAFDPRNINSATRIASEILNDSELAMSVVKKATAEIEHFDWIKVASEIGQLYSELSKSPRKAITVYKTDFIPKNVSAVEHDFSTRYVEI